MFQSATEEDAMAFKDSLSSLGRNRALIIAFLAVLILVFYFDGLRNFLTSKINDPFAMLVLGSAPWVTEFFGWARLPVHWLLMAIEVGLLTWAFASLLPPVLGFLGHALPNFRDWETMSEKERNRQYVLIWVFLGAIASGVFPIMLAFVLLGTYKFGIISLWAMQEIIARYVWPVVCLTEVVLQAIPMIVRQQTKGVDVVADQWTSVFPMAGVIVLAILGANVIFRMVLDGWLRGGWTLSTAIIELPLLPPTTQLTAAARGEESVGK